MAALGSRVLWLLGGALLAHAAYSVIECAGAAERRVWGAPAPLKRVWRTLALDGAARALSSDAPQTAARDERVAAAPANAQRARKEKGRAFKACWVRRARKMRTRTDGAAREKRPHTPPRLPVGSLRARVGGGVHVERARTDRLYLTVVDRALTGISYDVRRALRRTDHVRWRGLTRVAHGCAPPPPRPAPPRSSSKRCWDCWRC